MRKRFKHIGLTVCFWVSALFLGCHAPESVDLNSTFPGDSSLTEAAASEGFLPGDRATGRKKIVAIVWDGWQDQKRIDKAFNYAINQATGWTAWRKYWVPGDYEIKDTIARVHDMINAYGLDQSQLVCLLIGKSLGGAKTYRMMAKNESFFDNFAKVAVVLVDPHEPGSPGDEGRADYWYDYVRFRDHSSDWNGNYDLAWQSVWNDLKSRNRLRFYNVYQRGSWPRGYSFSKGTKYRRVSYDHYNIADCIETVGYIKEAINFLVN